MNTRTISGLASGQLEFGSESTSVFCTYVFGLNFFSDEEKTLPVEVSAGQLIIEYNNGSGLWQRFEGGLINFAVGMLTMPRATGDRILNLRLTFSGIVGTVYFSIDLIESPYVDASISRRAIVAGTLTDRHAVQSLDFRDELTARGYGFYTYWERTDELNGGVPINPIPAGQKAYAVFTSPPDRYVALSFREVITNKERVFYRVYTGYSNVTPGNAIRIGKLKSNSAIATGSTFFEVTSTPNLTAATRVTNAPIFGTINAGNRSNGSLSANTVFRPVPPNTSFLLEINNQSTEATYAQLELVWAEIPAIIIQDGGLG